MMLKPAIHFSHKLVFVIALSSAAYLVWAQSAAAQEADFGSMIRDGTVHDLFCYATGV